MEKHFCTCVHIYNPKTRNFLLINHRKLGVWLQPGGHIDPDEDPEESALREVYEETGLKVRLLGKRLPGPNDFIQPLAIQKDYIGGGHDHLHIDIVYAAVPDGNNKLIHNKREASNLRWFSLEEILNPSFDTFSSVREWCQYIDGCYPDI